MPVKLSGIQIPKPILKDLESAYSDLEYIDVEFGSSLKETAEKIFNKSFGILFLNADYINNHFKNQEATAELIAWLRFKFHFTSGIYILSFLNQSQSLQLSDKNKIFAAYGNSYIRLPFYEKINLNLKKDTQYHNLEKNKYFVKPFIENDEYFNHQIKNLTAILNYNHVLSEVLDIDLQFPQKIKQLLNDDICFKLLEKSRERLKIDSQSKQRLKNKINQLQKASPTIAVIDDQINDGWNRVFNLLVSDENKLKLLDEIPGSFNLLKFKTGEKYSPPQIIFLDLKLAGKDLVNDAIDSSGFELFKLLKGHFPGVSIIIFSSTEDVNAYKKALNLGADSFWNKYSSKRVNETILNIERVVDMLLNLKTEEKLFNVFSDYMYKINLASKKEDGHWWEYVKWTSEDITSIKKTEIVEQIQYFNQLYTYYIRKKLDGEVNENLLLNYRTMLFQHAGKLVELIHNLEGTDYQKVNGVLNRRNDDLGKEIHNLRNTASHVHGWRELNDQKLIKLSYMLIDYFKHGYSQRNKNDSRDILHNSIDSDNKNDQNLSIPQKEVLFTEEEEQKKPLIQLFIKKSLINFALFISKKM